MASRNKITTHATADASGFNRGLMSASKQASAFGKQMKSIGRSFSGAFVGLFAAQSLISFGKDIANTIVDFEQAMADVKAITKATEADFKALKISAIELGESTKYQAEEVAKLQKEFGKLGFSTKEILNAQRATLNLATAVNADLAQAAAVAGSTIRGFGLDASEAGRVTDVMAESFTSSALDIERWSESMKYVAPVARAAGISLEETAAMMSQLADAGIHGSLAGTALRNIMSKLVGTGGILKDKIAELAKEGITLASAEDEVGRRSQTALIVLGNGVGTLEAITTAYENASGAAQTMADIQLDTIKGQIILLQSAWKGLIISTGEKAEGFEDIKGTISNTALSMNNLSTAIRGTEKEADEFVKTGGFLDSTFMKVVKAIGSANSMLGRYQALMALGAEATNDMKKGLDGVTGAATGWTPPWLDPNKDPVEPKLGYLGLLKKDLSILQDQQLKADKENLLVINQKIERTQALIKAAQDLGKETEAEAEQRKIILATIKQVEMENNDFFGPEEEPLEVEDWMTQSFGGVKENVPVIREMTDALKDMNDESLRGAQIQESMLSVTEKWNEAGQYMSEIFGSIRKAAKATNSVFLEWIGYLINIMGTLSELMSVIRKVIVAKQAEAMGTAIANGSAYPFPLNILAIASSVAAVVAAFASVPKFALGGIVPGSSYNGDKVPSLLNSGEMVLNRGQQSNLFNMLNNGSNSGGRVEFVINGTQLVGVLSNIQKRDMVIG